MAKTEREKEIETFEIKLESGEKCILRKPSRKILGQCLSMLTPIGGQKADLLGAGEWILNTCWVSGDSKIKEDDDLFVPAAMAALELVKVKEATLKKV